MLQTASHLYVHEVVDLKLPNDSVLRVEPDAGIYEATLLAFLGGHCHSLALAISEATGWPIVALDRRRDGQRVHVVVRRPDDMLVDITGAHTPAEMNAAVAGGLEFADLHEPDVLNLPRTLGWAEPMPRLVEPWVQIALAQCEQPALPPMETPVLRSLHRRPDGIEVLVSCDGEPRFEVRVRRSGGPWAAYPTIRLPREEDGLTHMPFHMGWFDYLVDDWLDHGFDPVLADERITEA